MKKKSLVGWIRKDWILVHNEDSCIQDKKYIESDPIHSTKAQITEVENPGNYRKVRITIEELK